MKKLILSILILFILSPPAFNADKPSLILEDLTWMEAEKALKEYEVVLIALGARTKEWEIFWTWPKTKEQSRLWSEVFTGSMISPGSARLIKYSLATAPCTRSAFSRSILPKRENAALEW